MSAGPVGHPGDRLENRAGRPLPYNPEAEQRLLGAILNENAAYHRVVRLLRAEDFGNALHARIFTAAGELIAAGQAANPVTLKDLFDQDSVLADVGGARYLAQLTAAAAMDTSAASYANLIRDLAERREVIAACQTAVDEAFRIDPERPARRVIQEHTARLTQTANRASRDGPLELINPVSLADKPVPQRCWLVEEWVPMRRVTGLYGAGGEGKTLITQMLATACAIGANFFGLPVRRCRSLLHYCEDDLDEMHRRQEDINRFYKCGWADLEDMRWLPRLGEDNTLMDFFSGRGARTPLFEQLLRAAKTFEAGLVIEDTLADVFGGNEVDRSQARKFVQECLAPIARETGGALIATAHPSMSGLRNGTGTSGSTGWDAAFRSRLYLWTPKPNGNDKSNENEDPPDPDSRMLTRRKANFARREDAIALRWEEGVFITRSDPGVLGSINRRTCERVFLDLLDTMTAEEQPVSSNLTARNYAPRIFLRKTTPVEREGYTLKDLEQAMRCLIKDKRIFSEGYGRRSNEHYRLRRVAGTSEEAARHHSASH